MGNIKYLSLISDDNNLDLVEVLCTFYLEEYHSNYIIYSLNKRSYYNQNIINIVNEEAASYFEGQKSAKEVAQIIQSRVQIYVDENS